jgi:hypothetical protein
MGGIVPKGRSQENTQQKQQFVKDAVGADQNLTMNRVGKMVQQKFGTTLAFPKLREAFVAAGGKVDTRRGNRKGKAKGPAKAKGAAKAKSAAKGKRRGGRSTSETTKAKQDFVAQYVSANKTASMNEAGKAVVAKFGSQLSFDKLKQAFTGAGGKVGKPGRKPKARARVESRKIGRRSSDVAAARATKMLKDMPAHVVVMHVSRNVETTEFGTRDQAVDFARRQLLAGIPASKIAYYTRQPLQIQLGI